MSKIDHLNLDGNTLRTFITVFDEKSVSRAAERLGVSQSAVSHTLEKLRAIFDDPLFVREGRGIESTPRARSLRSPVESALDALKALTDHRAFNPHVEEMEFTIAANDFPIQLIFPSLLRELADQGITLRVRFIPSGIPSVSVLRESRYRMLITPTPPVDPELEKMSLLQANMEIFYDSRVTKPPTTWKKFTQSNFVEVQFSDTESSLMALPSLDRSQLKSPIVSVPNFSSLEPMITGTDRITIQIGAMKLGLLQALDVSPLPFKTEPLNLFLIWHRRENDDPAHRWFREKIIQKVKSILKD